MTDLHTLSAKMNNQRPLPEIGGDLSPTGTGSLHSRRKSVLPGNYSWPTALTVTKQHHQWTLLSCATCRLIEAWMTGLGFTTIEKYDECTMTTIGLGYVS